MNMKPYVHRLVTALFVVVPFALLLCSLQWTQLSFSNARYMLDTEIKWHEMQYPFRFSSGAADVRMQFDAHTTWPYAGHYQIVPDNCIISMAINGRKVEEIKPNTFCNFAHGHRAYLGKYLQHGSNSFEVLMRNDGGPGKLEMYPSLYDPLHLGAFLFVILGWVYAAFRILKKSKYSALTNWVLVPFTIGLSARVLYVFTTPFHVRGHDVYSHTDYINFLVEHMAVPPVHGGWAFYHPPLYYFMGAVWKTIGLQFGRNAFIWTDISFASLILVTLTLAAAVWIGLMLYAFHQERLKLLLFCLIAGTLPGLVFFSSRINNDVLLQTLSFGALAFLIYWWSKPQLRSWLTCTILIALALLTKSNALLLVPIAIIALLLHPQILWPKKIQLLLASLSIILIGSGWFYAHRFVVENQSHIVGNIRGLAPGTLVQNTPEHFTEFNPLRLVKEPFNDVHRDESGRQHFFEFLFRSAFFGEFRYGNDLKLVSSIIIALALTLIPFGLFGFYKKLRGNWRQETIMWSTLLVMLGGHIAFRIVAPYSHSQDFRYSTLLMIPVAYFVIEGIYSTHPYIRKTFTVVTAALCALCVHFLILLCL